LTTRNCAPRPIPRGRCVSLPSPRNRARPSKKLFLAARGPPTLPRRCFCSALFAAGDALSTSMNEIPPPLIAAAGGAVAAVRLSTDRDDVDQLPAPLAGGVLEGRGRDDGAGDLTVAPDIGVSRYSRLKRLLHPLA